MHRFYYMQTIPKETVLKGGDRPQTALWTHRWLTVSMPRHSLDSMPLLWKVLESLLNQEPPL